MNTRLALITGLVLGAALQQATAVQARAVLADAGQPAIAAASQAPTGSLQLRAELQLVSTFGGTCPPGASTTTECPSRTGQGRAPGLGSVSVAYTYLADLGHPACASGSVRILGYPVRLTVAAKGELQIAVAERDACLAQEAGRSVEQAFSITGGTGIYAGASGSGTVTRALSPTNSGAAGIETWTGTLTVPGLEFDTTAPTIAGATSKTVKAKKGAKNARVVYRLTAQDDKDGTLAVACTPRSGSRFKIGRTRVTCSASDSSGSLATASFTVTVRKTR